MTENQNRLNKSDCDVILRNPHISSMTDDVLYHLSLSSGSYDLQQMFGDIKFVCMGGTPKRMESFANFIQKELNIKLPTGTVLDDISKRSYRYSMYKIGPVLSISHGMGIPSLSIMLHEVIKLMYHAKCKDVIFIRLGTCGGIGLPGGTLVITESVVDGLLRPYLETHVLGKTIKRPAVLDKELAEELMDVGKEQLPDYNIVMGKTMCTYDFYEGQGRLDGAFCDYNEQDKLMHLEVLRKEGVTNIEMESLAFAAMCSYAGIKGAVVCVTLLNRLHGDQVSVPKSKLEEWQHRPQELAAAFIKKRLNLV
ncbi:uridine phosphorylase 1-like [Limulus polyphemus]|uniref:Uridine phosphorylase 1-like n=1 Tax=Limulus polyphemus TaxID=6850 RepID=A0ABM1BKW0_LIMPO|nr:uridine phosphorylase 1-like [Limulus polyphemus]